MSKWRTASVSWLVEQSAAGTTSQLTLAVRQLSCHRCLRCGQRGPAADAFVADAFLQSQDAGQTLEVNAIHLDLHLVELIHQPRKPFAGDALLVLAQPIDQILVQ